MGSSRPRGRVERALKSSSENRSSTSRRYGTLSAQTRDALLDSRARLSPSCWKYIWLMKSVRETVAAENMSSSMASRPEITRGPGLTVTRDKSAPSESTFSKLIDESVNSFALKTGLSTLEAWKETSRRLRALEPIQFYATPWVELPPTLSFRIPRVSTRISPLPELITSKYMEALRDSVVRASETSMARTLLGIVDQPCCPTFSMPSTSLDIIALQPPAASPSIGLLSTTPSPKALSWTRDNAVIGPALELSSLLKTYTGESKMFDVEESKPAVQSTTIQAACVTILTGAAGIAEQLGWLPASLVAPWALPVCTVLTGGLAILGRLDARERIKGLVRRK